MRRFAPGAALMPSHAQHFRYKGLLYRFILARMRGKRCAKSNVHVVARRVRTRAARRSESARKARRRSRAGGTRSLHLLPILRADPPGPLVGEAGDARRGGGLA